MAKNSLYFIMLMLCLNTACSTKQVLGPKEYLSWIASNDAAINSTKDIGNYTIAIKYLPQDYLTLKEFETPYTNIDKKKFDETSKKFAGHHYFLMRITDSKTGQSVLRSNGADYGKYAERLNYFAFNAQNDFKLVDGIDTIDCVLHHFENNYSLSPINDITIVFPKKTIDNNMVFIWNDPVLGLGTIKFAFDKEDLKTIPTLKIN